MSRRRTRPASPRAASSTRADRGGPEERRCPRDAAPGRKGGSEAAMNIVLQVLLIALEVYLGILLFRLVMDWVFQFARDWRPGRAMVVALEATYTVTDPPLKFLRRFIPPLRLGGVALDLSFFVLMIILWILISV